MLTPNNLFVFYIGTRILTWIWIEYLSYRQKCKKRKEDIPLVLHGKVPENEFFKSQNYTLDKLSFQTYCDLASLLFDLGFVMTGLLPYCWDLTKTFATLTHLNPESDVITINNLDN